VSYARRVEIRQLAAAPGYTGNATARALALGRHGRVALMLPAVENEYFARILSGAAELLHERGLA
jgi:LacI family transcriptional regulator